MEADKVATGSLSLAFAPQTSAGPIAPLPNPPTPASAPVPGPKPVKEAPASGVRKLFTVELRQGETTIVSWKKLLRESGSGNGEASGAMENKQLSEAGLVTGVRLGGEDLKHTLQPPNCFSTVIEKIERLYMGKESSDEEELEDIPDDEQYDTEDSFIDDTELDEYFQVDKLSTKHNGYFVNRGKLEWIESSSSPNLAGKKPRRKDSAEVQNEMDRGHAPNELVNRGNMKIKAAARTAPLVAKKLTLAKGVTSVDELYQEGKFLKAKQIAAQVIEKKRSVDMPTNIDASPSIKVSSKDLSLVRAEQKDFIKNKPVSSKGLYKSCSASKSLEATYQTFQEKTTASQLEPRPKKSFNGENDLDQPHKIQRKDRYEACESPQMRSSMTPYSTQTIQSLPHRVSEVTVRPRGNTLERAIRELENIVTQSIPQNPGAQEIEPSFQGVRRRLPLEIKQKLARVARLSVSHGKVSEKELIDRIMSFLGHLVQRKTLRRNIREMVESALCAKRQKAEQFLQIKEEVLEMVKSRVSNLKSKMPDQHEGSADDFQDVLSTDERRALTGRYTMDIALEEKLCDLYDLCVEGMDTYKGPQSRRLYVELAGLWPAGYMDCLVIKDAISRAKKRRRLKLQVCNEEKMERKKMATATKLEGPGQSPAPPSGQEKQVIPSLQAHRPPDKPISNPTPPNQTKLNEGPQHFVYDQHEKGRGNTTAITSDAASITADVRKRMKRKSEIEGESHAHPHKMQARPGKVKQSSYRPGNDTNLSLQQPKPVIQMPSAPI